MKFFLFIINLILVSSCSISTKSQNGLRRRVDSYHLKDNSGEYVLHREVGFSKNNELVAKVKVSDSNGNLSRPSERLVAISSYGSLKTSKKKINAIRPKTSAYELWLEGKKHSNKIKINVDDKSLDVFLSSPIMEWNGKKSFKFPTDNPLFCFFSQVPECAVATSFIAKAIQRKKGKMNFYIIWNGYPFFSEMYSDIPRKLFSKAELIYESKISDGEYRFSLNVENQKIFYHMSEDSQFKKMFWISQGLSLVKKEMKKEKKKSM